MMVSPWEIATTVTRAEEDRGAEAGLSFTVPQGQGQKDRARKQGPEALKVSRAGILYNHTVKAWEGCACVVDTVGKTISNAGGAQTRFTRQFG
jgi:hypothetical protein